MRYEALIKVDMDTPRDAQVSDIRMGLHEVAQRLVSEFGCDPADVRDWLEEAADEADEAEVE